MPQPTAAIADIRTRLRSMSNFPIHTKLRGVWLADFDYNHAPFFNSCIILILEVSMTEKLSNIEAKMDWSDRIGRRVRLRDLHILLAVVQRGSIAKAAQHLAISQPVVSRVIAELEHVLGVRLLDRDRHGAEPTIYGSALLKHGIAVFDELRQSVKEIEFLTDPTAGELRIGCTGAMGAGLLPVVIGLLHRRHPRLTFHVMQAGSVAVLYRELRERNVDLILGRILIPNVEDDLSVDTLFEDQYLLTAGS